MLSPSPLNLKEPKLLRFRDFDEYGAEKALADYLNSFSVLRLPPPDADDPTFREVVALIVKHGGFFRVSEYFCLKAIGNDSSMKPEALEYWQSLDETGRREYVAEFSKRHERGKRKVFVDAVRAVDRHADRANVVLRSIRFPEDGGPADERTKSLVKSLLDETRSMESLVRILSVPARTRRAMTAKKAA